MEDIIIKHPKGQLSLNEIEKFIQKENNEVGNETVQALIDKIKEQQEEIKELKESLYNGAE